MKELKIINIEGIDGTGKETQAHKLKDRLISNGYDAVVISFPNYDSGSFAIDGIKKVLSGDMERIKKGFAKNPYAVSMLYALDRFLSIDKIIEDNQDKIIIFDRYVESNICYQSVGDKGSSIMYKANWLYDMEYGKLELPKPSKTILLDLPIEHSIRLREGRGYKSGTDRDIYEEDNDYLSQVRSNSLVFADGYGWSVINVVGEDGEIMDVETISDLIWEEIEDLLKYW